MRAIRRYQALQARAETAALADEAQAHTVLVQLLDLGAQVAGQEREEAAR